PSPAPAGSAPATPSASTAPPAPSRCWSAPDRARLRVPLGVGAVDQEGQVEEPAILPGQVLHTSGAGDVEVVEAPEELLEGDAQLQAGERGADADVRTDAEGELAIEL